jgi:hypothetical protein
LEPQSDDPKFKALQAVRLPCHSVFGFDPAVIGSGCDRRWHKAGCLTRRR